MKSNFEELDRQIREAMAHMMEREEAMKMVNDLNENVDGKVDRLELQPFKDYVGECHMSCVNHIIYIYICMYSVSMI